MLGVFCNNNNDLARELRSSCSGWVMDADKYSPTWFTADSAASVDTLSLKLPASNISNAAQNKSAA